MYDSYRSKEYSTKVRSRTKKAKRGQGASSSSAVLAGIYFWVAETTTTMFRMMLITITTATSMMALMPSWSASTKTTTLAWSPPSPSSSRQLGRRPPRRVVCPLFSSSPTMEESAPLPTSSTSSSSPSPTISSPLPPRKVTLARWLSAKVQDYPELRDVESLHLSIQMACKTISNLITATTSSSASSSTGGESDAGSDAADDSMRRLDRISKNVLTNALKFTGRLRVVEAPPREECDVRFDDDCPPPVGKSYSPGVVIAYALDQYGGGEGGGERGDGGGGGRRRRLAACFDPLDGSGNADAAICTGTVVSSLSRDGMLCAYVSPFSCRLAHLSGRRKLNPARPSLSGKVRDIRRRRRPQVQRRRLVRSARRRRRVVPFPLGPPARIRAPSGRVLPVLLHDHARIHPRGGDARLHPRPHHERVRAHPPQHENTEEGQHIQLQRELR